MKVALVYDRVNKWGGAERILLSLHKLFPNAPLYTSVYDRKRAPWASVFDIRTSFLQNIPFASSNNELLAPLMPLAFESFDFSDFDLVISVTSEAAKGVITKPQTKHICYCLTPTRYLWSGYNEYFKNDYIRFLSKPVISKLRYWDVAASKRPDAFIAISKAVQKRIKKYYDRKSELVYPPVSLQQSNSIRHPGEQSDSRISKVRDSKQVRMTDYFLVVSRLSKFTKYKRVDLAIEVCNDLNLNLIVIGEGSWKEELEGLSGPTIKFAGKVSDKELANYYKNCRALIFPGYEDLGLVMIEAQSFGKPVIAYGKGGALELIVDKKTGLFFDQQSKESLIEVLKRFNKIKFDPKICVENAKKFDYENFKNEFLSVVNRLI